MRSGAARQRGAAAVFAAIATVAGLSATALAIDLGRVYYFHRDLQRMANLAALDSARAAGGCLGRPGNPQEAAFSEAVRSVQRNGGEASFVSASGVLVGRKMKGPDGSRYFDTVVDQKNRAVQVSLARSAPMRLFPLGGDPTRPMRVDAAAYSSPQATVIVGSKLAEADPELVNNVLSPMIGGNIEFDAVTYRNLAGASVPLEGLITDTSVGTPEELLATPMPVGDLFSTLADLLAAQGNSVAQQALQQLADAAGDDRLVTLRELIGIDDGFEQPALDALVNVGALVQSASQLANGTNLIDLVLPAPSGLTQDGTGRVRLIEGARQAILAPGDAPEAFARNAQGMIEADLPITAPGVADFRLRLFVQTARATAQVDEIYCARRGQDNDVVHVNARSAVALIGVGEFDNINAPNPQPRAATLGTISTPLGPARLTGFSQATVPGGSDRLEPYEGPFDEDGITQDLGTASAAAIADAMFDMIRDLQLQVVLPSGEVATGAALAPFQPILQASVKPAIEAALRSAGEDVLVDLSRALGITIGGADVTVLRVQAEQPYLFTH